MADLFMDKNGNMIYTDRKSYEKMLLDEQNGNFARIIDESGKITYGNGYSAENYPTPEPLDNGFIPYECDMIQGLLPHVTPPRKQTMEELRQQELDDLEEERQRNLISSTIKHMSTTK